MSTVTASATASTFTSASTGVETAVSPLSGSCACAVKVTSPGITLATARSLSACGVSVTVRVTEAGLPEVVYSPVVLLKLPPSLPTIDTVQPSPTPDRCSTRIWLTKSSPCALAVTVKESEPSSLMHSASPCRLTATSGGSAGSRSEEHTSELQSLMRNSYAVFCLKKKKN